MEQTKRIKSIDRFRGIICFCMVFFQLLEKFPNLGFISTIAKHNAQGINLFKGYMLADAVEPFFLFFIGLTFIRSFKSRNQKDGKTKACSHLLFRYLAFIGAGFISFIIGAFDIRDNVPLYYVSLICIILFLISIITFIVTYFLKAEKIKDISFNCSIIFLAILGILNIIDNAYYCEILYFQRNAMVPKTWGVLQSIGIAGLFSLIFVDTNTIKRVFACIGIFTIFTVIHEIPGNMELIDVDVQGGLVGGLGWAFLLLYATIFSDLLDKDREKGTHYYIYGIIVSLLLSIIGANNFVINKGSVSPGYLLASLIFGVAVFYIFYLFENKDFKFNFFSIWGKNPFWVFILQTIFSDFGLQSIPNYESFSAPIGLIISVAITMIMTIILYKTKELKLKI